MKYNIPKFVNAAKIVLEENSTVLNALLKKKKDIKSVS